MFLRADRALSKFNFLFHLKSKKNLVTLRKCNSHLQYYKIDLSFSIKLQEINLYVCEEYKIEREAHDENVVAKRVDFFIQFQSMTANPSRNFQKFYSRYS